jgi:hypothetical protein
MVQVLVIIRNLTEINLLLKKSSNKLYSYGYSKINRIYFRQTL